MAIKFGVALLLLLLPAVLMYIHRSMTTSIANKPECGGLNLEIKTLLGAHKQRAGCRGSGGCCRRSPLWGSVNCILRYPGMGQHADAAMSDKNISQNDVDVKFQHLFTMTETSQDHVHNTSSAKFLSLFRAILCDGTGKSNMWGRGSKVG